MARVYSQLEGTPDHEELLKYLAIYPDEILHQKAEPFSDEELNDIKNLELLSDKMFRVMNHFGGIGLAGPQANIGKRILVIDLSDERHVQDGHWFCFDEIAKCEIAPHLITMINPEILELDKEFDMHEEGCLSLPGIQVKVKRPISVKVKFLLLSNGKLEERTCTFKKLLGRCVQHEIDHIDGILITDKPSKDIKKIMIDPKLKKLSAMDR